METRISVLGKMKGSVPKLLLWGWPEALATEMPTSLAAPRPLLLSFHKCQGPGKRGAASQAGNILVRVVLGLRGP